MNTRRSVKSWLASITTLTFFMSNVVGLHAAESSMWAERRAAAQRMKGGDAASGLDSSSNSSEKYQLLVQLPKAAQVNPFSTMDLFTVTKTGIRNPGPAQPTVPAWLSALVLPYGSIRNVHLSKNRDAPLVVHIQDAHEIEESQKNTASMIKGLSGRAGVALVGLEGAAGAFDFTPYRSSPDKEASPRPEVQKDGTVTLDLKTARGNRPYRMTAVPRGGTIPKYLRNRTPLLEIPLTNNEHVTEQIAGYFLKNGYLGGAEYAAITLPKPPLVWGVEALDIYLANIKAYQGAVKIKPAVDGWLKALEAQTEPLKAKIYSNDLKTFDKHYRAYKDQHESLGDYVVTLLSFASPEEKTSHPNLQTLLKALVAEESLDFKLIEKERVQLVEALVRKLPKPELDGLLQKSLDYRTGRMGYGNFHQSLKVLCRAHGISLAPFEQFNAYVDYLLLADHIDRNALLAELDSMEEAVPAALAKTPEQKSLVTSVRYLAVLKKLTNHQMTPADWSYYSSNKDDIARISEKIAGLNNSSAPPAAEPSLAPFEDFCRLALQRNQALVGNLMDKMKKESTKTSFLVAGGFHTDGMMEILREKGASYIVVTPKITDIPKESHALEIFARDPLPLEKLFTGEKIYLLSERLTNPEVVENTGVDPRVPARAEILEGLYSGANIITPSLPAGEPRTVRVDAGVRASGSGSANPWVYGLFDPLKEGMIQFLAAVLVPAMVLFALAGVDVSLGLKVALAAVSGMAGLELAQRYFKTLPGHKEGRWNIQSLLLRTFGYSTLAVFLIGYVAVAYFEVLPQDLTAFVAALWIPAAVAGLTAILPHSLNNFFGPITASGRGISIKKEMPDYLRAEPEVRVVVSGRDAAGNYSLQQVRAVLERIKGVAEESVAHGEKEIYIRNYSDCDFMVLNHLSELEGFRMRRDHHMQVFRMPIEKADDLLRWVQQQLDVLDNPSEISSGESKIQSNVGLSRDLRVTVINEYGGGNFDLQQVRAVLERIKGVAEESVAHGEKEIYIGNYSDCEFVVLDHLSGFEGFRMRRDHHMQVFRMPIEKADDLLRWVQQQLDDFKTQEAAFSHKKRTVRASGSGSLKRFFFGMLDPLADVFIPVSVLVLTAAIPMALGIKLVLVVVTGVVVIEGIQDFLMKRPGHRGAHRNTQAWLFRGFAYGGLLMFLLSAGLSGKMDVSPEGIVGILSALWLPIGVGAAFVFVLHILNNDFGPLRVAGQPIRDSVTGNAPTIQDRDLLEALARILTFIEGRETQPPSMKGYNEINASELLRAAREAGIQAEAAAKRRVEVEKALGASGTAAWAALADAHAKGENPLTAQVELSADTSPKEVRRAEVLYLASSLTAEGEVRPGAEAYNDVMADDGHFDLDKAADRMAAATSRLKVGGTVTLEASAAMRTVGANLTGQEATGLEEFRQLMQALSIEEAPTGQAVVFLQNFKGEIVSGGERAALTALADRAKKDMSEGDVARALSRMTPVLLNKEKGKEVSVTKNASGDLIIVAPGLKAPVMVKRLDMFALDAANYEIEKGLDDLVKFLVMLAGNLVKDASKSIGADIRSLTLINLQA